MRVKVKIGKDIQKKVTKAVQKEIKQNFVNKVVEDLKKDIRNGINPKTGKSYRALKPSTIANRRRYAKKNPTHPQYSPARSNLTFTGRLIESIKGKFNKTKRGIEIEIEPTGIHAGYNLIRGGKTKAKKNKEIAEALAKQKRYVVQLSKKRTELIVKKITQLLKKRFR